MAEQWDPPVFSYPTKNTLADFIMASATPIMAGKLVVETTPSAESWSQLADRPEDDPAADEERDLDSTGIISLN
jgi:hypothetical protein